MGNGYNQRSGQKQVGENEKEKKKKKMGPAVSWQGKKSLDVVFKKSVISERFTKEKGRDRMSRRDLFEGDSRV